MKNTSHNFRVSNSTFFKEKQISELLARKIKKIEISELLTRKNKNNNISELLTLK